MEKLFPACIVFEAGQAVGCSSECSLNLGIYVVELCGSYLALKGIKKAGPKGPANQC